MLRQSRKPAGHHGICEVALLDALFRDPVGYGGKGCSFGCPHYAGGVDYQNARCPNVERAHFERVITHEMMRPGMSHSDLDDVASAFRKVWQHLTVLQETAVNGT